MGSDAVGSEEARFSAPVVAVWSPSGLVGGSIARGRRLPERSSTSDTSVTISAFLFNWFNHRTERSDIFGGWLPTASRTRTSTTSVPFVACRLLLFYVFCSPRTQRLRYTIPLPSFEDRASPTEVPDTNTAGRGGPRGPVIYPCDVCDRPHH